MVRGYLFDVEFFLCFAKMEEDQWMHDNVMFEEVDVNEANGEEPGVHQHVDSFDAFNIFQVLI